MLTSSRVFSGCKVAMGSSEDGRLVLRIRDQCIAIIIGTLIHHLDFIEKK